MKKTIIIFTNPKSVDQHIQEYKLKNPLSAGSPAVVETVNSDKQFIFAYDGINESAFDRLVELIPTGDCYMIYHGIKFDREKLVEKLAQKDINCPIRHQMKSDHADRNTYGNIPVIEENSGRVSFLENIFNDMIKRIICSQDHSTKVNKIHECLDPAQARTVSVDDERQGCLRDLKKEARSADGMFDKNYRAKLITITRQWFSS